MFVDLNVLFFLISTCVTKYCGFSLTLCVKHSSCQEVRLTCGYHATRFKLWVDWLKIELKFWKLENCHILCFYVDDAFKIFEYFVLIWCLIRLTQCIKCRLTRFDTLCCTTKHFNLEIPKPCYGVIQIKAG